MASRWFLPFSLGLYGVGAALSQSLMSLGGTIFAGAFFWGLWDLLSKRGWRDLPRTETVAIISGTAFVLLSLLRLIWVEDRSLILDGIKNIPLFVVPLCALLPSLREKLHGRLKAPLYATAIAYFISFVWAAWQIVIRGDRSASGPFGNPIYYAYNLLPAIAFFMSYAWLENRRVWIWVGLATLLLGSQVLSASRMATIVGAGIWIFFLLLLCWNRRRMLVFVMLMASLGGASYLAFQHHEIFYLKFRKIVHGSLFKDSSWRHRNILWKHNWELFRDNPVLGVGYKQNYIDTAREKRLRRAWKPGHHIYAHSIYSQSLAESGLLGSSLHLTSLIALGLAAPATIPVLGATALGGTTENIFHNSKVLHSVLFFLLLSGLIAPLRKRRLPVI